MMKLSGERIDGESESERQGCLREGTVIGSPTRNPEETDRKWTNLLFHDNGAVAKEMARNEKSHLHDSLQNKETAEYVVYFDFLRLVALFLVVMLHVAGRELLFPGESVFLGSIGISNAFDSLCRCAVPLFVMISGALFLKREISIYRLYSKNVMRIVRVFAIWTVIYALDVLFHSFKQHDALLPVEFIEICLQGHYHLWFLQMMACLYLIVPFLLFWT